MKLLYFKIFTAIHGGDLKSLKQMFEISTPEEVKELLSCRSDESLRIRRPSNGKDVHVYRPTPLIAAVADWYTEIVDYLTSFRQCLDLECTVDDVTNTPQSYGGVTALHLASMAGKLKMVQSLVKHGASVDQRSSLGDSSLFEASFEGHLSVAQHLTKAGARVDLANHNNTTCLMIASFADNAQVVQHLVENGSDISKKDKDERNALFYTVAGGRCDTLNFLLENGAKIQTDKHGVNVLMEAVHHKQFEIVKFLMQGFSEMPIDPKAKDKNGRNALFYLVENENTDILEYLLGEGIPIEPASDGRTLLMVATLNDNKALVKFLVDNALNLAVDINEKDNKGRNCLFYCITGGDEDLFDYLVSKGVRIEPSSDGISPLMQAVAKNKFDFAQHLIDKREDYLFTDIDLDAQDKDGWTPVLYSVAGGHLDVFVMLTSHGAQCLPAADGRTILMQAAAKGDVRLIRQILDNTREYKIYPNQKDVDGWNCLFYTIQGNHVDAFKLLVKRGAKVCTALNGATPLMEAVDKGRQDMVEYLVKMASALDLDLNHRDKDGANVLFYSVAGGHLSLFKFLVNAGCKVECDNKGRSLLMQGAMSGHAQMLQYLVLHADSLKIDLHGKDKEGRNALFYCVEGGHLDALDYLVSHVGIDLTPSGELRTILMVAVRNSNYPIVTYLLERRKKLDLDLNAKDIHGENAMFYALRSQSMPIVKLLLESGIHIDSNNTGVNVLSQSMSEQKLDIVSAILSSQVDISRAVNGKDTKGRTLFHHCIYQADSQLLAKLSKHYDSSADGDVEGATALMVACRKADTNIDLITFLVEDMHVDIHQCDLRNKSALFYAIESSNLAAVTYLLDKLERVEDDVEGRSPLTMAITSGNIYLVDQLLLSKFGKDLVTRTDKIGRNPIHYCALLGREKITAMLYTFGCEIDLPDECGTRPIMLACSQGYFTVVAFLLRNGSLVDNVDKTGRTGLHYCFGEHPSLKCVKLLVNYGAETNDADSSGTTPLMLACRTCTQTHISIISYLLDKAALPCLQDNEGHDSFDHCPFNADYVQGKMRRAAEISDSEKAAFETYRTRILEEIDLNSVLRGLLREKVITKTLNFEVVKRPHVERIPKLLDILTTRGPSAFRLFCKVLKDEYEVELSFELMKAAYRRQDEILV